MSDTETVNGLVEEVTTYVVQLQAENAKLQASNEVIAEDHAALCVHNAKLRELLDYMTPIAWYAASERERDRMRKLGVEVDG